MPFWLLSILLLAKISFITYRVSHSQNLGLFD
jgi:hypothetical protein